MEKEEAQREAEWKDWLQKRFAELGFHKWFFWRNCLKELQTQRKLSIDALGGGSTSPSREVPAEHISAGKDDVDPVTTDPLTHLEPHLPVDVAPEETEVGQSLTGDGVGMLPEGLQVDSVGGFDVPPSRGVSNDSPAINLQSADHQNIAPIQILQPEYFASDHPLGPDFFEAE